MSDDYEAIMSRMAREGAVTDLAGPVEIGEEDHDEGFCELSQAALDTLMKQLFGIISCKPRAVCAGRYAADPPLSSEDHEDKMDQITQAIAETAHKVEPPLCCYSPECPDIRQFVTVILPPGYDTRNLPDIEGATWTNTLLHKDSLRDMDAMKYLGEVAGISHHRAAIKSDKA